uniref:MMS19 nucleotide excision repair protein n=1 Tax=Steinernema glaseri TaxID=37863 RepID=A0A1I8AT60_9BILA
MLWRQRIFCQLVPLIMEKFRVVDKENSGILNVYFSLICPLLDIARGVPAVLSSEFKMLLPMFTEALKAEFYPSDLQVFFAGVLSLLKLAPLEGVPHDQLKAVCYGLAKVIKEQNSVNICLIALECLDTLVKRGPKERLVPFYSRVITSLVAALASSKRVVRKAAAETRNKWELIITV